MLYAAILFTEIFFFYYFYSRHAGVHAIYFAWFAWIIDVLAILSGSIVMSISIFVAKNPTAFNFVVPFWFILLIYVMGSWQASIHAVKLFLRIFQHEHIRKAREQLASLSGQ